jgi:hypothetical protein
LPYWSVIIVLSTFLQLPNVKPTQVCSAQAGCQVISTAQAASQRELWNSILPLKKPTDYYSTVEQKRTGSQYDKNEQLTLLSQRKLALTSRNM